MIVVDADRWRRLGPRPDELLDLDVAQRARRLRDLQLSDPALAEELARLIGRSARADAANFMAGFVARVGAAGEATLAGLRIGAYVLESPLGQGGAGDPGALVASAHRAPRRGCGPSAARVDARSIASGCARGSGAVEPRHVGPLTPHRRLLRGSRAGR